MTPITRGVFQRSTETGKPRGTKRAWGIQGAILESQKGGVGTREASLDKNQSKNRVCSRAGYLHDPDGPGNYRLQGPQQRWYWWKEDVVLLTTRLGWRSDGMHDVSSVALGLKHFEDRARPYEYVSDIQRLTATF